MNTPFTARRYTMFPILSLPNDLIYPIVEAVDNELDLISLAQTCRKLQPLAEARILQSVYIRNGDNATKLSQSLEARPARLRYVKKLDVTPRPQHFEDVNVIPGLVRKMTNLRELRLESPYINFGGRGAWWIENVIDPLMRIFREANERQDDEAPLQNLRSFVLHSHGKDNRFGKIDTIAPIFMSRTLNSIHVSCIDVEAYEFEPKQAYRTPLETLVLDECNIEPAGLVTLLALPRNLSSLSLQENAHHLGSSCRLNQNLPLVFSALGQQKHSLQYLQHLCGQGRGYRSEASRGIYPGIVDGFSTFENLHVLELSFSSALTNCLSDPSLAPPSIETYHMMGLEFGRRGNQTWNDILRSTSADIPLKRMEFHGEPSYHSSQSLRFKHLERLQSVITTARILKDRNILWSIVCYEQFHYIPPYVYGEQEPRREICFDSEEFWQEEERLRGLAPKEGHDTSQLVEDMENDTVTILAARVSSGYVSSESFNEKFRAD